MRNKVSWHCSLQNKRCLPRRKTPEVERTFHKCKRNHWLTYQKIINDQLGIELGEFKEEGLDAVVKKIKSRKTAAIDEIPTEVWTRKFDDILLQSRNAVYKQKPNREMDKITNEKGNSTNSSHAFCFICCIDSSIIGCLVVGRYSRVLTLKGSILALVYPWYTNTQCNRRKDKIKIICIYQEYLIFYVHNITNARIHKCIQTAATKHILFHEQAICRRGTK